MTVVGNHQAQADCGFGSCHGNRKNGKHHARQAIALPGRVLTESPKSDQIQVRRVEHQLDSNEDKDRVAPRKGNGEPDGKDKRSDDQERSERRHWPLRCPAPGFWFVDSGIATMTAPIKATVNKTATISS